MLGFLPVEKIPIFMWGLILAVIGGFLAIHEEFLTKAQITDFGMVVVGVAAFFYDVRARRLRAKNLGKS